MKKIWIWDVSPLLKACSLVLAVAFMLFLADLRVKQLERYHAAAKKNKIIFVTPTVITNGYSKEAP